MKLPEIQMSNEASIGMIQTGSKPVAADLTTNKPGRLLEVVEVKPGLHEVAEGITGHPVYRISWDKKPGLLSGLWHMPGNGKGSGRFLKLSPESITMPKEAAGKYRDAARHADETAVFMSTRLGDSRVQIVLASRSRERWLELYRGTATWRELGISRFDISSF